MIPIKATVEDLDSLLKFLRPTFGWVTLAKVKANLGSKVTDNRKVEAARYLGFIERESQNIRITDQGRAYSSAQTVETKAHVMREQLAKTPLYLETMSWMYHSNSTGPSKTDVAEQWHKHQTALLQGAQGAALTDGVIVFMRAAEAAGLGKFITAGRNRPETKFRGDAGAIEKFAETYLLGGGLSNPSSSDEPEDRVMLAAHEGAEKVESVERLPSTKRDIEVKAPTDQSRNSHPVQVTLQVQISGETPVETVEAIFRSLRKYVLSNPEEGRSYSQTGAI
jgi:hypothetical protein